MLCVCHKVHTGDFTNWGALSEASATPRHTTPRAPLLSALRCLQVRKFGEWFAAQPHKHKIIVPGNHDMLLDDGYYADYWADWSSVREDPAEASDTPAPHVSQPAERASSRRRHARRWRPPPSCSTRP
jgi:hypothetical protein